jgi:hypothetical protein
MADDEELDLVRYGTVRAWSKELGIPAKSLRERLKAVPHTLGRTNAGGRDFFYAEYDVRRVCADLL